MPRPERGDRALSIGALRRSSITCARTAWSSAGNPVATASTRRARPRPARRGGRPGPGLVDCRLVRRGIAVVRARRGARVRERGRGPLGQPDVLCRLAVLYLGRVPHVPRGGRRRPAAQNPARRRFFVYQPRRIDWWATAVQLAGTLYFNVSTGVATQADLAAPAAHQHVWRPTRSARSASWSPARWPGRGLSRLGRMASARTVLVDNLRQSARLDRLRRFRRGRRHQPGDRPAAQCRPGQPGDPDRRGVFLHRRPAAATRAHRGNARAGDRPRSDDTLTSRTEDGPPSVARPGYRLGSDRGSPNQGSTLLSKRVMAQIRSPVRVST